MGQGRYADIQLVTPKTVYSTVMTDGRTRIWFSAFLTLPQVKDRILRCCADAVKQYRDLAGLTVIGFLFLTASAGLSLWVLLSSQQLEGVKIAVVLFLCGGFFFLFRRRHRVASLSAMLIELDQSMIPSGTTLYQVGERYSREYGVLSLVDMISGWNQWLRDTFLFLCLATFGIYFLSFWKMVLWISIGCLMASFLVRFLIMRRILSEDSSAGCRDRGARGSRQQ